MRQFYEANVREPLFVFVAKLYLIVVDDQDVGISFASATFSVLLIWVTYLLGALACSRWVGAGAALALAIERDAIDWGVDGWKDDAFAAFVVLSAYGLLRLSRVPSFVNAALAGTLAAAACLTRITSLSFLLPGYAAVLLVVGAPWKVRLTRIGLSLLVMSAIVGPYLINCARAYGDPFYSINYHTRFYLSREGRPSQQPMPAADYIGGKLWHRPLQSSETMLIGLTSYPFLNKWRGFDIWFPGLGWLLACCALPGVALWLRHREGQFLLMILVASLLPYALTWPIAGGAEWRFTFHAYPFFLIASFLTLELSAKHVVVWSRMRRLPVWSPPSRPVVFRGLRLAVLASCGWGALKVLPYLELREALAAGEAATITAGNRYAWLFRDGWTAPVDSGQTQVRFSRQVQTVLLLPLPRRQNYRLALRIDPFETETNPGQVFTLFVNSSLLTTIVPGEALERNGAYEVALPAALVREGLNRIDLLAARAVPAALLGSRVAGVEEGDEVAFRFWSLTVVPQG